jgi:hypothetical protein
MHLWVNQQDDDAAYKFLRFIQQQRRNLQDKQWQLQRLTGSGHDGQTQQRSIITRGTIKSKQQQEGLERELQQMQQRLQEFDRQVNAAELEQLLATAVARTHTIVVHLLGLLPAAAQLPATAVMQLLRCSIMHKSHDQGLLEFMLEVAAIADDAASSKAAAARTVAALGADTVATAAELALVSPEQQQQQQQQREPQVQVQVQVLDDPQQVLVLLETAVQYSNSEAVQVLTQLVPAAWALKASAVMPLARTLVQTQERAALTALCALPGMQQLGGQQLRELLWWAAKLDNSKIVKVLTSLPGAQQLTGVDMTAVLMQAAQTEGRAIEALMTLPAKRHVCWQSCADLLEAAASAAAGLRSSTTLKALLQLPCAEDVGAATLKRLLQDAIAAHDDELLHELFLLPDTSLGLTQAADVLQLMLAALDAENCSAVAQLCDRPDALGLSSEQLQLLISEIISRRVTDGDELVIQLCADLKSVAEQLQSNQVFDLMREVVEMGGSDERRLLASGMLEALGELPGATNMQPDLVTLLLNQALTATSSNAFGMVRELCDMEAARNTYTDQLAPVVHLALTRRSHRAAFYMLGLPCAQAWSAEDIVRCLHVLLWQLRSSESPQIAQDIARHLLLLPLAREIPASELQQLVQMLQQALGSSRAGQCTVPGLTPGAAAALLQALLDLLPHDDAGAAVIQQLLCYALQHNASSAKQMLQVKAADVLDAAAVQRLLELAVSAAGRSQQQQQQQQQASSAAAAALLDAVELICELPGAQQLQPDALAELLRSALMRRTPEVLKCLAQIDGAAERMEKGVLLGLLKTAMQRMTGRVSVYCRARGTVLA